jgi:hypothetical protein
MHEQFLTRLLSMDPFSPAVGPALSAATTSGELRRFIAGLLNDTRATSACAERSFPHPLGFLKIVLATHPNGEKLRLHVWPNGKECGVEQDIHDHFWDFCSVVLQGEMEFLDFIPADRGENYYHYRLLPTAPSAYEQVYLGKSALSSGTVHRLRAGDWISVGRTTLHRAYPTTSGLCATLLLQGPQQSPCNNIYSSRYEVDASKIVSEQPVSESQLRELLEAVASILPTDAVS